MRVQKAPSVIALSSDFFSSIPYLRSTPAVALRAAPEEPGAALPQQDGNAHNGGHKARKQKGKRYVRAQQQTQPCERRKPPVNIRSGRKFCCHIDRFCISFIIILSCESSYLEGPSFAPGIIPPHRLQSTVRRRSRCGYRYRAAPACSPSDSTPEENCSGYSSVWRRLHPSCIPT